MFRTVVYSWKQVLKRLAEKRNFIKEIESNLDKIIVNFGSSILERKEDKIVGKKDMELILNNIQEEIKKEEEKLRWCKASYDFECGIIAYILIEKSKQCEEEKEIFDIIDRQINPLKKASIRPQDRKIREQFLRLKAKKISTIYNESSEEQKEVFNYIAEAYGCNYDSLQEKLIISPKNRLLKKRRDNKLRNRVVNELER